MKPHELSQALRIRQLRARRAEEDLRRARGLEAQAGAALAMARNSLQAFDDDLAQRMEAFFERASEGVDPGAVEGMRTFHSDQLSRRGAHVSAISSAAEILAEAERASALARDRWQQASNAAENLQALSVDESRRRQREMERRIEMDVDELAVGLAARRNREQGISC